MWGDKMNTNLIKYIEDINKSFFENSKVKIENPVTELHMHKILFFLYGSFWKKFYKELFNANFEAWKYGPVEINYRNNKDSNKNLNILFPLNVSKLSKDEKEYLDNTIRKLLKVSAIRLMEASHLTNVWKNAYDANKKRIRISNDDIKTDFINTINI